MRFAMDASGVLESWGVRAPSFVFYALICHEPLYIACDFDPN